MTLLSILEIPTTIIGVCLGIGLAAAAGFRVFIPLFVLSLAVHFGNDYIPLSESWKWIGDMSALITLGVATVVEIFSYYIPVLDNALDTIAIPLATVAGTVLMASQLGDFNYPVISWALAIIAGGGTAAAIKSTAAGTRATSTVTTAGLGNNLVSTAETGIAGFLSIISIFLPVIAFILVIIILIGVYKLAKLIKNSIKAK